MKRIIGTFLAMIILCASVFVPCVSSANEIFYDGAWHEYVGNFFALKINNEELKCEVPPIVFNDYSVVPARDVFEKLGATVSWNAENERVTINYEKTDIILYINKTVAYKNGKTEVMPIAPKIINGKTMIPARYVSESFGFDVNFDSKTDTISIKTKEEEKEPVIINSRLKSYSYTAEETGVKAVFNFSNDNIKYSHFALKSPDRIVLDLTGVDRAITIRNAELESEIVSAIRLGQNGELLRIVFDIPETQKYTVKMTGKSIIVTIGTFLDGEEEIAEPDDPKKPDESNEPEEPEIPIITFPPSRSITIDPGHGGPDPGACYIEEDGTIWKETDINLAVSLKVRDILEENNVRVVMTRTKEKEVERKSRPELANKEETALFISIHTNSVAENETANGIETWGSLEASATLGGVDDKKFAQNVQKALIKETKAVDRGIKDSVTLTVLKYSVMPSILVELGFITNETERDNMFSEAYQNKLAKAIADGILKTFDDMGV
ncbi:MAG: N-acetylmuramoyl-L-alanine amidase [Clostridia bacterium]|nr:N-acetylmuramoyl-L-alanine amidase [Clostridia bacterium]